VLHDGAVVAFWAFPATIVLCLASAGWLLRRAQRRLVFSLEQVVDLDTRPPILFLRPFADDHVRLPRAHVAPLRWLFRGGAPVSTLEQLVLERFTQLGPVIAVGNPADAAAPFGAARAYMPTDAWRARVLQLIADAQWIVICVDSSAGVRWEFEQIVASGQQHKCLFVVHPRFRGREDNASLVRSTLNATPVAQADVPPGAAVLAWHVPRGGDKEVFCSSSFSETAFELVMTWFLKKASEAPAVDAAGETKAA
jgi:hypothetical protein